MCKVFEAVSNHQNTLTATVRTLEQNPANKGKALRDFPEYCSLTTHQIEIEKLWSGDYSFPPELIEVLPFEVLRDCIPHRPRKLDNQPDTAVMVLKRVGDKFSDIDTVYQAQKIGRFLNKATDLTSEKISELTAIYRRASLTPTVRTTSSSAIIAAIYKYSHKTASNGECKSCMTGNHRSTWDSFISKHPAYVYGNESGVKLAYIMQGRGVMARGLYSEKNKSYVRIYGAQPFFQYLKDYFINLGYTHSIYALDGHVLNHHFADNCNFSLMPYVDGHQRVKSIYLNGVDCYEIDRHGDLSTSDCYQTGSSEFLEGRETCAGCDDTVNTDHDYIEHGDSIFCDTDCLNNAGYCFDLHNNIISERNSVMDDDGNVYDGDHLGSYGMCFDVNNNVISIESAVDFHGVMYHEDDLDLHGLTHCESCGEIIKESESLKPYDLDNDECFCSESCLSDGGYIKAWVIEDPMTTAHINQGGGVV
jgi:hypothetical protein